MADLVPQFVAPEGTDSPTKRIRADSIRSGTFRGQYNLTGSILVLKDNLNSASGFLAFGTTRATVPTTATSGTGVYIDYTGIYGLASGTAQFYLLSADGQAYAGAGAVRINASGIIFNVDGTNGTKLKWYSIPNDYNHALIWATESSGDGNLQLYAQGQASNDVGSIQLSGLSGGVSQTGLYINNNGTAGTYFINAKVVDGFSIGSVAFGTAPSSLLHLASTAPTFRMEDTTASAKSLLLTTNANLTKFEEAGGGADNLLVLDLANNRAAFGTATTVSGYKLVVSGGFRVAQASGEVFTTVYTGASGSGSGNVFTVYTDDGAALASGDRLATFYFGGADDASHTLVAGIAIIGKATEAWDSTHHGSRFDFVITPNAGSGTTAATLDQDSTLQLESNLALKDGITAPGTLSGYARIYVDTSDGDLKVKFGDGTVKTIATDT